MRQTGLILSFTNLGDGRLVLDRPADELLRDGTTRHPAPAYPSLTNMRLIDGEARVRPGFVQFANLADSDRVTGMFQAVFSNGTAELLRGTSSELYKLVAGTWTAISGAITIAGSDDQPYDFAMVRRTGASVDNQCFIANGANDLLVYTNGAASVSAVGAATFTAPHCVASHQGRALVGNVEAGGSRREQRLYYSVIGDSTDFTGLGSGYVELDDDPYAISRILVVGGRVVVYKGDGKGGSVVVGTPTGDSTRPYRWDTLPGRGLLMPRGLVQLSANQVFLASHDGFFLHDGVRGFLPVMQESTNTILGSLNYAALGGGVTWYNRVTKEVVIGIPTGASETPTTYYVFSVRDKRLSGVYSYQDYIVTAAAPYVDDGTITWNDLDEATWDDMAYPNWNSIGGAGSAETLVFGAHNGYTLQDDDTQTLDIGSRISASVTLPAVTSRGQALIPARGGQGTPLPYDAVMTLRDVTVRYLDTGIAYNLSVEVSTNGTSWTSIYNAQVASTGTGKTRQVTASTATSDTWLQVRVSASPVGNVANTFQLRGVIMYMQYAGESKND